MAERLDTGKLLLWGGIGFVVWKWVLPAIRHNVTEPLNTKAYAMRMRLGKVYAVKFKDDTVEFKLPIENPNPEPMTVTAIVGDVYVMDGKGNQKIRLGTVAHYGTDKIKATGSTDFDLFVKIKLVNEFLYFSKLLGGKWIGQTIRFRGTITANNRPWPIDETFRIA